MPTLIDRHLKIPKYLQIAEHLRQDICTGRLQPGDRLPSFSEMRVQFEAGQDTVEKVHALLEKEELIRREHGRGVFVNHPATRKMTGFVGFLDRKVTRDRPYHQEIQRGVREEAARQGKSILMMDDPVTFKQWDLVDSLILEDAGYFTVQDLMDLEQFPSRRLPLVRMLYEEPPASSVIADDETGITMSVDHLVGLGHSQIGYLGNDINDGPLLQKRHAAYVEAMSSHGITADPSWSYLSSEFEGSDFRDFGYEYMQNWLAQGWEGLNVTAILVQNDYAAMGVMHALEENKLRVPADVSIVGYDGIKFPTYDLSRLTTVKVPLYEMGAAAVKLLSEAVDEETIVPQLIQVPVRFVIGESTAEPRKANKFEIAGKFS